MYGVTQLYVMIQYTSQDIDYIRAHYNIEDFVYFDYHHPLEHSHLHHFVLNPVFSMHSKFFLKVCLRYHAGSLT